MKISGTFHLILLCNYVPQLQVLQNTDVFITHCGMNSTSEALYYDVPLVMNPMGADQPMVAERVKQLGAGIMLDKSELNPLSLRKSVETILSDQRYAENASKIGESLRNTGGYRQGVEEIFSSKCPKSASSFKILVFHGLSYSYTAFTCH